MTLRSRLTITLVLLTTVGLSLFGVVTHAMYKQSLETRLDDQLRSAIRPMSGRLTVASLGIDDPIGVPGSDDEQPTQDDDNQNTDTGGGPGFNTFAALVDSNGNILATSTPVVTSARPDLPDDLNRVREPRFDLVDSVAGTGQWRLLSEPLDQSRSPRTGGPGPGVPPDDSELPEDLSGSSSSLTDPSVLDGAVVVVAAPTTELDAQLRNLLWIEFAAALTLLSILGGGAWLVLRHGLRPLETMAESSRRIAEGDLAMRVSPADETTEVGQLGVALNTMLEAIEASFSEREATEAKLRQFLADVSHELRTPLTSIRGFAELFRLRSDDDHADLPVIMGRIEDESDRMKGLVDDLLLLARLDQTRPFQSVEVDLSVLCADACTDASAVDPTRPITLNAPEPVIVHGDVAHLRQAIANLLTNALRHTPESTPLEVSARSDETVASVAVRDHGSGLTGDALAHAFDRFWRADSARTGSGSGLGLAIVASIAEEHGGRAHLSNHPDGGAVAVIEVPRVPPERGIAGGAPTNGGEPPTSG